MKIQHRTVGWLGRRIAATLGLLFGANFIAVMVVAISMVVGGHGHEPAPDWFARWATFGMLLPMGAVVAGALIFGVVRLIAYWRD